jgi:hypothetical protein
MLVTGVAGVDREEKLQQIERIVASQVLHGSESLCKLLRYLAEHCIDHPGTGLKEYQIATELFGRPANFDPRIDATVRVQSGRLRSKLGEYYAHSGAADPWVIEVPKGAYSLVFSPRPSPAVATEPAALSSVSTTTFPDARTRTPWYNPWQLAVVVLSIGLTLCLVALVPLLQDRANGRTAVQTDKQPSGALAVLWKNFVDTPDEPWVIFSNAEFVGRPETGMHYSDPEVDKGQAILDHYTGVGEVLGIHELDRVFASLRHGLRVKRGRLLSLDDAKNNDLIFVGSPSENLSLLEIPTANNFVFRRMEKGSRKGDLAIVNTRARPGEGALFLANEGLPITEDYAVIGLMPGLNPTRWIMLLAGITTIGTQAAVEYVSRQNTAEDLLKRINSASGKAAPFEAVLRVKVAHGVPVQTEVVALRLRN